MRCVLRIHSVYVYILHGFPRQKHEKTHTYIADEQENDKERECTQVLHVHITRILTYTHNTLGKLIAYTIQLRYDQNDQVYDYKQLLRNFMTLYN